MTTTIITLPFQNITEYKQWRTEWKVQYKQLSADIRAAKLGLRSTHRTFSASSQTYAELIFVHKALSALQHLQLKARAALANRVQSKIKAAELYDVDHPQPTTVK
jgi:hypothetical protein